MTFVFLHTGNDSRPKLLVKSIRRLLPKAEIIQCSDSEDFAIEGIDHLFEVKKNNASLMMLRLEAFSSLKLSSPAIYLDTDILLIKKPDINRLLFGKEIAVCRRSFHRDSLFNSNFRGMDLSEYSGKSLDQVYPYLASFNITTSFRFWDECKNQLEQMDKKFHLWYGDQEAMKKVIKEKKYDVAELKESEVSCLPEYFSPQKNSIAIHFKGQNRKSLMESYAKSINISI